MAFQEEQDMGKAMIETIVLQVHRDHISTAINDEVLLATPPNVELLRLEALRATRMLISATTMGTPKETEVVEYPADWWQAFKARWFRRWMLKRWPAKYERRTFERWGTYPEIPCHPNDRSAMVVHRFNSSSERFWDDGMKP